MLPMFMYSFVGQFDGHKDQNSQDWPEKKFRFLLINHFDFFISEIL